MGKRVLAGVVLVACVWLLTAGTPLARGAGECTGQGTGFFALRTPALRDKGVAGLTTAAITLGGGDQTAYLYGASREGRAIRVWTQDTGWHTFDLATVPGFVETRPRPWGPDPTGTVGVAVENAEIKVLWLHDAGGAAGDEFGAKRAYILATGLVWCP